MTRTWDSPEALAAFARAGFRDPERAGRLLDRLCSDSPPSEAAALAVPLLGELGGAPDADMALLNLERWASRLATPRTTFALLREDPRLTADLAFLCGGSQYLADILARDPQLYTLFFDSKLPPSDHFPKEVAAALRPLRRPESRRDALRRVKRKEFLRIGWRDLARRQPFGEIVREISDLAEALIGGAFQLAWEETAPRFATASESVRLAVIAFGKLGARELNYSSDVDLVFVMDTPGPPEESQRRFATRLAETIISILTTDTAEGRCFRVDMRLRPEGRTGALVRSYSAFRDYYDRWAETWERQALIKARPVAGDAELGKRFLALVRPVAYRRFQGATLLEDVREMRAAVERKLEAAGTREQHVKEGRGTIRDVEFTVQLLQLLFGAEQPQLQVRDTWTALERLEETGLLAPEEHDLFAEGYRFFRETEHRLQLLHDLPVRVLPTDPVDLRRLARSMRYRDAETFLAAYREQSDRVRSLADEIHRRLGVSTGSAEDPLRLAALAADTPEGEAVLRGELEARNFPVVAEALPALVRLAAGDPHYRHPLPTRRLFADLAPAILDACAASADPTLALVELAAFADRKLLHRAQYQTWAEQPEALNALCRFAGAAPAAMRRVLRYPELVDFVVDPEQRQVVRPLARYQEELRERLAAASSHERRLSALRRFKHREYVRLAARHMLAPVPSEVETAEWSDLAEALLQFSLAVAVERAREERRWTRNDAGDLAILALGRFGGRELHFGSDLDLLYVHGPTTEATQQQYEALAKAFGEVIQTVTEEGPLFELDLRLRPEGRQGFAVASLEAARRYYGEGGRGQTWELQMLTRLRPIAGDSATAAAFAELVLPRVYREPMPESWTEEIRAMKRRIETERVSERDRETHLKLGPGGLSDIEFLAQYLQLRHGGAEPALRDVSTRAAIAALMAAGYLKATEAEALLTAHEFLTRLRQTHSLVLMDSSPDALPVRPEEARRGMALARAIGYADLPALLAAGEAARRPVRELLLRGLGPL